VIFVSLVIGASAIRSESENGPIAGTEQRVTEAPRVDNDSSLKQRFARSRPSDGELGGTKTNHGALGREPCTTTTSTTTESDLSK